MQPNVSWKGVIAPLAAPIRRALIRGGCIAVLTLTCGTALPAVGQAESSDETTQSTGASNGGVASAETGGEVNIGQIVTGENTGNSIVTGNISGSAEIDGGEIDYPTDDTVSLELGPPIATADGGDQGEAASSTGADSSSGSDGDDGEEITIINRNDNRSNATVTEG